MRTPEEMHQEWVMSPDRTEAEAKALGMWPETLHLGRWDGLISDEEVRLRLNIQRRAYMMGAKDQWMRDSGYVYE